MGDVKMPSLKRRASWEKIAKKHKEAPFFRIVDYNKYKVLEFYNKTLDGSCTNRYRMPLVCNNIVFLSRFFPDDVDFFREELIKTFNNMRRYEKRN